LARKSPAPKKPSPPTDPAPETDALPEQRVKFLLDYISRINRQALAALYQIYAGPDCQVAQIPALRHFDHDFPELKFRATGFLTRPQEDVLKNAANQSLEALLTRTFLVAKALSKSVVAAENSLVAALMTPPNPEKVKLFDDSPEPEAPGPLTGCCYYYHSPPVPDMPQLLCEQDPDYYKWVGGVECVT
jgi:hypothetical protein